MLKTALVVLAAGKSSRMGSPKQLLDIFGKSMITRVLDAVLESNCYPIVTVLGANKVKINQEIEKMPITVIENPNFESGISSSIVMGMIGAYMTSKEIEAIIFVTSDQPQISKEFINKMVLEAQNSDKKIIASKFTGGFGIPALFKRDFFEDILSLNGDSGAKSLILKNKNDVGFLNFEDGNIDLDTPDDYKNYINLN